jgi:hypothetical protein
VFNDVLDKVGLDEDVLDNPEPSKILPSLAKPKRTRKAPRRKKVIGY